VHNILLSKILLKTELLNAKLQEISVFFIIVIVIFAPKTRWRNTVN